MTSAEKEEALRTILTATIKELLEKYVPEGREPAYKEIVGKIYKSSLNYIIDNEGLEVFKKMTGVDPEVADLMARGHYTAGWVDAIEFFVKLYKLEIDKFKN